MINRVVGVGGTATYMNYSTTAPDPEDCLPQNIGSTSSEQFTNICIVRHEDLIYVSDCVSRGCINTHLPTSLYSTAPDSTQPTSRPSVLLTNRGTDNIKFVHVSGLHC
jgi:hypothetical protein